MIGWRVPGALAGLILVLGLAVACGGGDDDPPATTATGAATATPSPTRTATATPSRTPSATPSPTPTPEPYNGAITRMAIPSIGVDAPIEEIGVTSDNQLDTPRGENTHIGWYYLYDKPGRVNPTNDGWMTLGGQAAMPANGNAVFSAHVYYNNVPAPFANLYYQPVIALGADITVTMEDGRQYQYRVIKKDQYNRDTIPMGEIIWPSDKPADAEWITLISCGGQFDSTGVEYVDRIVVVAERIDDGGASTQT